MASPAPTRSLLAAASPSTLRRTLRPSTSAIPVSSSCISCRAHRPFTTAPTQRHEIDVDTADRPRWQQTPRAMVAPVRSRPLPHNNFYEVNSDPRRLDDVYNKMLGRGGDKMLTEEVKWLAVTHKSFDHGRRGFNDRLALLGKRIVELQTSLALLAAPKGPRPPQKDEFGRKPFQHPALDGLEALTEHAKRETLDKRRLSHLAQTYGLDGVVRWKPKKSDNLQGSGVETVMANTIYAVVGAIALEKGGEVAIKTVRDKILSPLGLL